MKIKRVLFLTPRRSDKYLGGVEKHVKILSKKLREKGIGVGELSLTDVTRLPRAAEGGPRNDKIRAWKYLWNHRKQILDSDIIHVHDIFWWYSPFRFLFFWKPVFITFHGWEGVYPPSKSAILQKKMANLLCGGSIGAGKYLEKWYGVKVDGVTHGVLDDIFIASLDCHEPSKVALAMTEKKQTSRNDKTSIVFLGRLEEVNGIEMMLEAIRTDCHVVPLSGTPRNDILFVGDGSYRKKCEKYGIVTGMVKNVNKYLEKADLVIASSYLSIMEAMAMGKPVIAIANNPLKLDYLKCYPMAEKIEIAETVEQLKNIIWPEKIDCHASPKAKLAMTVRKWLKGQTPERLADIYESLWRVK